MQSKESSADWDSDWGPKACTMQAHFTSLKIRDNAEDGQLLWSQWFWHWWHCSAVLVLCKPGLRVLGHKIALSEL